MKHTLALSMIVRDAARELDACLASCCSVVDEILIADTGSGDNTVDIARSFGARVVEVPWTNDFAAARNAALQGINSEWIVSLDADERLGSDAGIRLPDLLRNRSVAGYQVSIRNYVLSANQRLWDRPTQRNDRGPDYTQAYPAYLEHHNVRLFRRDPRIYFVGRVHESVGPRILESGLQLAHADFAIHHFGLAATAETRAQKNALYRQLGRQKLAEMPQDAQAHFELGLGELDHFANVPEALELFQQARRLRPRFGEAWFFEGFALVKQEKYQAALAALAQAERVGHHTSLVAATAADAYYNLGQFAAARAGYQLACRRSPGEVEVESKLGLALVREGQAQKGLAYLQRAIAAQPGGAELHDRLLLALVCLDRLEEAAGAADAKLGALELPVVGDFLRAASLWFKVGKPARSAAILQVGLEIYPGQPALLAGLEQLDVPLEASK